MQLLTLFVYRRRDDGFHHLKIGDDSLVGQWRFCSFHRNNQLPSNFVFYVANRVKDSQTLAELSGI